MPELPPEIHLKIFEHFPGTTKVQDAIELSTFCLVSKAFLEPARDVLYRRLRFPLNILASKSAPPPFPRSLVKAKHKGTTLQL